MIPVVIAFIGMTATGLGALLGARAARYSAQKHAQTVRQQVQDQGAMEHGHWLRQQRLSTYESFLEAWDSCMNLTRAAVDEADSDATGLEELSEAAGQMAARARRIALLGPEEVTRAAQHLAQTMQEDVEVSTRFIRATRAALATVDGRPIPVEAVAQASADYGRRSAQLAELIAANRAQGRSPNELDGHPLLREVLESIQARQQSVGEAREAMAEGLAALSSAADQASAMLDVLRRNQDERELSRERFTSAAREALSTAPLPAQNSPRIWEVEPASRSRRHRL